MNEDGETAIGHRGDIVDLWSELRLNMNTIDFTKSGASELLDYAKKSASTLHESLPKQLQLGAFTLNSKLPWKATLFRELLLHRFSDFVDVAVELYDTNRIIPAFVITRAIMENTAILYSLHSKTESFIEARDEKVFDEFLMKGMFGSRNRASLLESYNVLTAIDRIDKVYEGTRKAYDNLSEFTHPNYDGVLGAYALIDQEKHITHLGKHHPSVPIEIGLIPLDICLEIFSDYYNSLAGQLKTVNDFYEKSPE